MHKFLRSVRCFPYLGTGAWYAWGAVLMVHFEELGFEWGWHWHIQGVNDLSFNIYMCIYAYAVWWPLLLLPSTSLSLLPLSCIFCQFYPLPLSPCGSQLFSLLLTTEDIWFPNPHAYETSNYHIFHWRFWYVSGFCKDLGFWTSMVNIAVILQQRQQIQFPAQFTDCCAEPCHSPPKKKKSR